MLSFYLDYQVNESFLETAVEYENVRRHTRNSGYKHTGRPAAFGLATFYVIVPASTSGLGPDFELIPILNTGTEVGSDTGTTFVLMEDVDFSNKAEERLTCDYVGDDIEIGFNSRFIIDMLNNIGSDNISLEMSEPNRAGILLPLDGQEESEETLMLVMPVMLNS